MMIFETYELFLMTLELRWFCRRDQKEVSKFNVLYILNCKHLLFAYFFISYNCTK